MSGEDHYTSKFFQTSNEDSQIHQTDPSVVYSPPTKQNQTSHDCSQSSVESETDTISLSGLTIEDQVPLQIKPFFNITPREMPVSPHCIIEEEFAANPWALLIATVFLNKTSGRTARRHIKTFFDEYPTPYHVLDHQPEALKKFFHNLGLKKRGQTIWTLTYQYVSAKWRRPCDLHGIGKYGDDAYRLFCLGHTDLNPDDRYLRLYLDWLGNHTDFIVENGITDCENFLEDPVLEYYKINLRDHVKL